MWNKTLIFVPKLILRSLFWLYNTKTNLAAIHIQSYHCNSFCWPQFTGRKSYMKAKKKKETYHRSHNCNLTFIVAEFHQSFLFQDRYCSFWLTYMAFFTASGCYSEIEKFKLTDLFHSILDLPKTGTSRNSISCCAAVIAVMKPSLMLLVAAVPFLLWQTKMPAEVKVQVQYQQNFNKKRETVTFPQENMFVRYKTWQHFYMRVTLSFVCRNWQCGQVWLAFYFDKWSTHKDIQV